MKAFNPHLCYLNVGKYIGYDPQAFQLAATNASKIQQVRAASNNSAAVAQALTNQTGGNIMGFTYE